VPDGDEVVLPVVEVEDADVGDPPQPNANAAPAAPIALIASRRPIFFVFIFVVPT
jgi:hypothetical protein